MYGAENELISLGHCNFLLNLLINGSFKELITFKIYSGYRWHKSREAVEMPASGHNAARLRKD